MHLIFFFKLLRSQYCITYLPLKVQLPKGEIQPTVTLRVLFVCNWGKKKSKKRLPNRLLLQGELCNFSVRARCTTFTNDCDIAVCYSLLVVAVTRRCKYSFPSFHLCLRIFLHPSLLLLRLYFKCI